MAAIAKRLAVLFLLMATGTAVSEGGCNCEATCTQLVAHLRQTIKQLQAEVRELRGTSGAAEEAEATRAARRAALAKESDSCGEEFWDLLYDADVEAKAGCRVAEKVYISTDVSSLAGLGSLEEVRQELWIYQAMLLESLHGLESLVFTSTATVTIEGNPGLERLTGLQLRDVWRLEIFENQRLKSLDGLESIVRIGSLWIKGNPELSQLSGLTSFSESEVIILITHNAKLSSLSGLQGLRAVNSLVISDCDALVSLAGLEGLTSLNDLEILHNYELTSLAGLDNLVNVSGHLWVSSAAMVHLTGLASLRAVGALTIQDCSYLNSFDFPSLEIVYGQLVIDSNALQFDLRGLDNLNAVGSFTLRFETGLISLYGLGGLTTAGVVLIEHCSLLTMMGLRLQYAEILHVVNPADPMQPYVNSDPVRMRHLGGFLAPGGSVGIVTIDERAWPLCITPHERMALVSAVRDMSRSSIPNTFSLNPNVTAAPNIGWICDPGWGGTRMFGTFVCTKGQPCSIAVPEEPSGMFISGRFTGCGLCWDQPVISSEGGQADLGPALRDLEAGLHSLCRCTGGAVAQILLRGPRQNAPTVCSRGHACTFTVDGDQLQRTDEMVLMSSCNAGDPPLTAASLTAENTYLFHDPATWYVIPPSRYQLCWRPGCTSTQDGTSCPAPESSYFHVGDVDLAGAFPRDFGALVLGEADLEVPNIGLGVSDGDRMRLRRACGEANEEGSDILEANSSQRFFRFGKLTVDRVQPGKHHLCWCQAHNSVKCDAEWDFMADSGAVEVVCPVGQHMRSRRCETCPAGRQQPEAGLEPCSECPVGKSSRAGELCEACEEGAYAALTGTSLCLPCPKWMSSNAEGTGCSPNTPNIFLLASFLLSLGALCAILVYTTRRKLHVMDVSLDQGHTIITTLGPHGFSNFCRKSFPAMLHHTGHPNLDKPSRPMRVKVKDAVHLELLTWEDGPIDRRLDTSMGTLTVPFPLEFYHQRWPAPAMIILPTLLIAVAALCFLVLQQGMLTEVLVWVGPTTLVCTAASVVVRIWPSASPLARRLSNFKVKLATDLPNPQRYDKGADRALTVGKLHEVLEYFRDLIRDRTAYYMDSNILKPLTKEKSLSYAELVGARRVEWFVSHFWGTAFEHFCAALQKHAESVCGTERWAELAYWVCFCSNNQHQLADELGEGWEESSFYITLRSGFCQGTCMVLDDKALPLTRIWCIFELLQTVKLQRNSQHFQGLLLCTSSGVLNSGGGSVEVAMALANRITEMDLEKAEASNETDRLMIQRQVIKEMGSFAVLNAFVSAEVHTMLMQAQRNSNQQFAAVLELLQPQTVAV